jgi:hypothetical protein
MCRVTEHVDSNSVWVGARRESRLPVNKDRTWVSRATRIAFDLGIAVLLLTAVPLIASTVWLNNWRPSKIAFDGTLRTIRRLEPIRAFTVPVDPSISPLEAGRALASTEQEYWRSPMRAPDLPRDGRAQWGAIKIDPSATHFGNLWNHIPSPITIFEHSTRGFTAAELDVLRQFAEAPFWRDFDRYSHAAAIDELGGLFRVPFEPGVLWWNVRPARLDAMDLTSAAATRAAYLLVRGQRDSAENVLRAVVSVGFLLIDGGTGLGGDPNFPGIPLWNVMTDQQNGVALVFAGSDALARFYRATHDPRAATLEAERAAVYKWTPQDSIARAIAMKATLTREDLLQRAVNPKENRGVRFASLQLLAMSQCGSVRDILFGPRADILDALERGKREVARYPSEVAYLELLERAPPPDLQVDEYEPLLRKMAAAASTVSAMALHNSRISACSALATRGRLNFSIDF